MKPSPPEGEIAPGMLVWGSDFNAASALLYRWWGILDAPPGTDTTLFWDDLFDADPIVSTPEVSAVGLDRVAEEVAAARAHAWSHHLDYDDIRLRWRAPTVFEITASARLQRGGPGSPCTEQRCLYVAIVRKRADGRFVFQSITATGEGETRSETFCPSFTTNRARATIIRFQAHMDGLSGKTDDMRDLMMPRLRLHGLVASKKDESSGSAKLTDVNDLRKSIAGSDHVADNVIQDFDGFTAWFATCTNLFTYGLHKLEHFSVKPLEDRRVEAVAQFDWRAETLNGTKIETHQPLTWILVDTDEAYMRIEALAPFG